MLEINPNDQRPLRSKLWETVGKALSSPGPYLYWVPSYMCLALVSYLHSLPNQHLPLSSSYFSTFISLVPLRRVSTGNICKVLLNRYMSSIGQMSPMGPDAKGLFGPQSVACWEVAETLKAGTYGGQAQGFCSCRGSRAPAPSPPCGWIPALPSAPALCYSPWAPKHQDQLIMG